MSQRKHLQQIRRIFRRGQPWQIWLLLGPAYGTGPDPLKYNIKFFRSASEPALAIHFQSLLINGFL